MLQAIYFLHRLLVVELFPQEASEPLILYHPHILLLLPQQVGGLEADWRTRLLHPGDFRLGGRKPPHTLVYC